VPEIAFSDLTGLLPGAFTIALVSFCSMMPTVRGFAVKNGYSIDPNQDLIALGIADAASGLTRGFAVSGAASRTAVADAAGGKTQLTSIVTAVAITLVLFFLTEPLSYLPTAALAAILISAAMGLLDLASLKRYYKISKPEFRHSLVAMLGVMTIGVLPGILIAVGLALLKLILLSSRPPDAVVGVVQGRSGLVTLEREAGGKTIPGLLIYRWEAAIVFYNSYYFIERVRNVISQETPRPDWFILDAESSPMLDVTGAATIEELRKELAAEGITFGIARAKGLFLLMLELSGVAEEIGRERRFAKLSEAAESYLDAHEGTRARLEVGPIGP
jgi:MFS superfamily sulfate permease-like transporter